MKVEMLVKKEVDIRYLKAGVSPRHWEDTEVNGKPDTDEGDFIPCKNHDEEWDVLIDIEQGKILNWEEGTTANVHYKVVDDGTYTLMDEKYNIIDSIDGYVPKIMCPKENGYGDYIIMDIDKDGFIDKWNKNDLYSLLEQIEDEYQ